MLNGFLLLLQLDGKESILIWERTVFLMETICGLTPDVLLAVTDLPYHGQTENWPVFSFKLSSRLISGTLKFFPLPQWLVCPPSSHWEWAFLDKADISWMALSCLWHASSFAPFMMKLFDFSYMFTPHRSENKFGSSMPTCTIKLQLVFMCIWNAPQKWDS